jgi:hypothetical protein
MEEVRNNSGQTMGIAALITAIITFIFAVIPCIGIIAIIPGVISIVLASVGLSQASRNNSPKGVLIAGLVIGIVAALISLSQGFLIGNLAKHKDKWPTDIQSFINDIHESIKNDLEDANISIKIESGNDKVEINTNSNKKDLEQKLEDLERGNKQKDDTVKKVK